MSDTSIIEAFGEGASGSLVLSLMAVAREYRDDPDFRARIEADPRGMLEARGVLEAREMEPTAEDAEIRLAVNTPEVFHLCLPADPNAVVSDNFLSGVAGGSSASSAGTVGSAGCASTAPSCFGTTSSASSLGSGGTASAQS